MRGQPLHPRFPMAGHALRINHVRSALLEHLHEIGNEFRWILKIGVNHDDRIAVGMVQASRQCNFLSEIAAEVDHRYIVMLF